MFFWSYQRRGSKAKILDKCRNKIKCLTGIDGALGGGKDFSSGGVDSVNLKEITGGVVALPGEVVFGVVYEKRKLVRYFGNRSCHLRLTLGASTAMYTKIPAATRRKKA
jgi:hypothetical protein